MMAMVVGANFVSRRVSLHVIAEVSRRCKRGPSEVTNGSARFEFFSNTVDAAPMVRIRLPITVSTDA